MWPNPLETADLVTFTEEILNGKFIILQCTVAHKELEDKVIEVLSTIDVHLSKNYFQDSHQLEESQNSLKETIVRLVSRKFAKRTL